MGSDRKMDSKTDSKLIRPWLRQTTVAGTTDYPSSTSRHHQHITTAARCGGAFSGTALGASSPIWFTRDLPRASYREAALVQIREMIASGKSKRQIMDS